MAKKRCGCRYLGRVGQWTECPPCKRARLEKGLAYWKAKPGPKAEGNVRLFTAALAELTSSGLQR